MQSSVTLVMVQPLVEDMICIFVTILKLIVNHTASLDSHINFLMVMSMKLHEQRNSLRVSATS